MKAGRRTSTPAPLSVARDPVIGEPTPSGRLECCTSNGPSRSATTVGRTHLVVAKTPREVALPCRSAFGLRSVARMAARDGSHPDSTHAVWPGNVQGQQLVFHACRAWERADLVVDVADLDAPTLLVNRVSAAPVATLPEAPSPRVRRR